jgi:hypothetical protein
VPLPPADRAKIRLTDEWRYAQLAALIEVRFLLLQTHERTDEVVERLLQEVRSPAAHDDTLVHQILDETR